MRVYQLTHYFAEYANSATRCFNIRYTYLSESMACDAFVKYFSEFNHQRKITSVNITSDYLNKLNVGKNMLEPCWDINVSIISQKIRLYSFDANNEQFPTEFNIYELRQFKIRLTEEYNNIVTTTTHEITLNIDEITSDTYLNSLKVGNNLIEYKYKFNDGSVSHDKSYFIILVNEFNI